jgi:hypothetical protein
VFLPDDAVGGRREQKPALRLASSPRHLIFTEGFRSKRLRVPPSFKTSSYAQDFGVTRRPRPAFAGLLRRGRQEGLRWESHWHLLW